MPAASSFLMKACRSVTSKPMWSSIRPLVVIAGVAVLANLNWTPGRSATGAWLRTPGFAPKVFTYQAWLSAIADSGRKKCTCSCRMGTALLLVFENLDLQAVGRRDEGLIEPVVVPGLHRHACSLPPGHGLLHVLNDEADVVHYRPVGASGGRLRRRPQIQHDDDAGKSHDVEHGGLDGGAAHAGEDFLAGLHVDRVEMPVSHGHAHLVGRIGLRPGRSDRQVGHEPQR